MLAFSPRCAASIRFLFVRPAICLGLPSDSQSPTTPLPLANTSPCRVCRGLSPPSHQRGHHSQAGCACAQRAMPGAQAEKPPEQVAFFCVEFGVYIQEKQAGCQAVIASRLAPTGEWCTPASNWSAVRPPSRASPAPTVDRCTPQSRKCPTIPFNSTPNCANSILEAAFPCIANED